MLKKSAMLYQVLGSLIHIVSKTWALKKISIGVRMLLFSVSRKYRCEVTGYDKFRIERVGGIGVELYFYMCSRAFLTVFLTF